MENRHVLEDGSTIVGDNDLPVTGLNLSVALEAISTKVTGRCQDLMTIPQTILSIPLGPRDVRTASPTAILKIMLD